MGLINKDTTTALLLWPKSDEEKLLGELLYEKWGNDWRIWWEYYPPAQSGPIKEVRVGTGGCGNRHVVYGRGKTLRDAVLDAGIQIPFRSDPIWG